MVSRLGEADAAREAAEMDLRSARDEFLSALLDVFREGADYFYDENTGFRVFYSVMKTGQEKQKGPRTGSA